MPTHASVQMSVIAAGPCWRSQHAARAHGSGRQRAARSGSDCLRLPHRRVRACPLELTAPALAACVLHSAAVRRGYHAKPDRQSPRPLGGARLPAGIGQYGLKTTEARGRHAMPCKPSISPLSCSSCVHGRRLQASLHVRCETFAVRRMDGTHRQPLREMYCHRPPRDNACGNLKHGTCAAACAALA